MDYEQALARVMADPRYQDLIEYGEPRSGHPEGQIKHHIADLEANLEQLRPRLRSAEDYWKLKFLIHVHDTFKALEVPGAACTDPLSHEGLARAFASEFTGDEGLLNILTYHDINYTLWKQLKRRGDYDRRWLQTVLDKIDDVDLFLIFTVIDGTTAGKDPAKLPWFIQEVQGYRKTEVDATWLLER